MSNPILGTLDAQVATTVRSSTLRTALSTVRPATTATTRWATSPAVTSMPTTAMGTTVPIATTQSNVSTGLIVIRYCTRASLFFQLGVMMRGIGNYVKFEVGV